MGAVGADDPYESAIFEGDIGAMERLMRSLAGYAPEPGYTEIANEGGIRWHQRIDEPDGDPSEQLLIPHDQALHVAPEYAQAFADLGYGHLLHPCPEGSHDDEPGGA